jgi:hypothetical protein
MTQEGDLEITVQQALSLFEGALQNIASFNVKVNCSRRFVLKTEAIVDSSPGR